MVDCLRRSCEEHDCLCLVYCFMPDHLHVMLRGKSDDANCLAAMNKFKQLSGKLLYRLKLPKWQDSFYDHVVRGGEDWRGQVTYIAMNPVRSGLVESFLDYPFTGSIGYPLQDVISR